MLSPAVLTVIISWFWPLGPPGSRWRDYGALAIIMAGIAFGFHQLYKVVCPFYSVLWDKHIKPLVSKGSCWFQAGEASLFSLALPLGYLRNVDALHENGKQTKLVFSYGSQTRNKVISIVYALVEAYSIPRMRLQEVPW